MKNIAASLIFFTRLPFWRLKAFQVSDQYYSNVVSYWSVAGWLTGTVMAGTLWLSVQILPFQVAVLLAIFSRIFVTGALHEDGLADFIDGFGGGRSKKRILEIMKDSHIGTYGVLALIGYFFLLFFLLSSIPFPAVCAVILIADPLCKYISSWITVFLEYARTAETSKSKTVYKKASIATLLISSIFGFLPLIIIPDFRWLIAALFPITIFIFLVWLMKKKIGGYTGDCCGAIFLLSELSFYLGIVLIIELLGA